MKIIHSPFFYITIIYFFAVLRIAGSFLKDNDGGAILSLVVLMAGMLVISLMFLIDWGIRAVNVPLTLKYCLTIGLTLIAIYILGEASKVPL